jgi:hypothetical protein
MSKPKKKYLNVTNPLAEFFIANRAVPAVPTINLVNNLDEAHICGWLKMINFIGHPTYHCQHTKPFPPFPTSDHSFHMSIGYTGLESGKAIYRIKNWTLGLVLRWDNSSASKSRSGDGRSVRRSTPWVKQNSTWRDESFVLSGQRNICSPYIYSNFTYERCPQRKNYILLIFIMSWTYYSNIF